MYEVLSVPTVLMKTWHIKMCAGHRQEVQRWDVGPMSDVGSGSTPVLVVQLGTQLVFVDNRIPIGKLVQAF